MIKKMLEFDTFTNSLIIFFLQDREDWIRKGISRALSMESDFIVADELVSVLDVSIQAHIINILLRLQKKMKLTILFISHDLAVVESIADRIAVMHEGKIVEEAETDYLIRYPHHP